MKRLILADGRHEDVEGIEGDAMTRQEAIDRLELARNLARQHHQDAVTIAFDTADVLLSSPGRTEQGCMPSGGSLAAVEAANVTLSTENAQLRQALRVIRKGLTEDADGEFWSARRWLDRRNIFHGDISGYRVLELVAKRVLHGSPEPDGGR